MPFPIGRTEGIVLLESPVIDTGDRDSRHNQSSDPSSMRDMQPAAPRADDTRYVIENVGDMVADSFLAYM